MKKSLIISLGLIISLVFVTLVSGEVRINEVELNPAGNDSGYEWIELYSDENINLTNWKLVNGDNQSIELNQTFQNYLIINLDKQWLDNNQNESVKLFNNSELIFETPQINDNDNNNKTWQYCNGDWNFTEMTKNAENSCEEDSENGDDVDEEEIYLTLDWDENDIINGEEFKIKVKAENLENKNYNVKIWIEFKNNDTIISDRYDKENDEWKSGKYYINNLFEGPGDENEYVLLRIDGEYEDFDGSARIYFKIRSEKEISKIIKILEYKEEEEEINEDEETISSSEIPPITSNVIKLGEGEEKEIKTESEDIKTKNNILYESKTGLMKKYSIYGFALLCVGLSILLLWRKLK